MQDKLIIQNFLGIDYLEIELKKLNILIGQQASGKSTIAKLFYYFNSLFKKVQACIYQQSLFKDIPYQMNLTERLIGEFVSLFDNILNEEKFQIKYFYSEKYSINISYNNENNNLITIKYSHDFHKFINKIIKKYQKIAKDTISISEDLLFNANTALLIGRISNSIRQDFLDKGIHLKTQIFIPAGRSYFATLHDNIFEFMDNKKRNIDFLLKEFGSIYQIAKKNTQKHQVINQDLFKTIIKAQYDVDDDGEFLIHSDGRRVSMAHASSGQQEALPILLIIQQILESKIKHEDGLLLYIEEPEAHLFPSAQKDLVHLFARVFNHLQSDDCHIFITTHSPYLLTSFNTLLTAGSIIHRQPEKAEKVYQVIPEKEILFSEKVGAYSLMNSKLTSLIDPDEELILAEVLDEVSGKIADEFDKLLDLKYDN